MEIEPCKSVEHPGWLEMRCALWPEDNADAHLGHMAVLLGQPTRYAQFVACDEARAPLGFIEVSLRSDYVNGTESSPVGFVEGVYVMPNRRRAGIARALFTSAAEWARSRGCRELASDALLENTLSHAVHEKLGFRETERVVYFVRPVIYP
jgi:aminoglycoside 6'-N-acetyltransferase I